MHGLHTAATNYYALSLYRGLIKKMVLFILLFNVRRNQSAYAFFCDCRTREQLGYRKVLLKKKLIKWLDFLYFNMESHISSLVFFFALTIYSQFCYTTVTLFSLGGLVQETFVQSSASFFIIFLFKVYVVNLKQIACQVFHQQRQIYVDHQRIAIQDLQPCWATCKSPCSKGRRTL